MKNAYFSSHPKAKVSRLWHPGTSRVQPCASCVIFHKFGREHTIILIFTVSMELSFNLSETLYLMVLISPNHKHQCRQQGLFDILVADPHSAVLKIGVNHAIAPRIFCNFRQPAANFESRNL